MTTECPIKNIIKDMETYENDFAASAVGTMSDNILQPQDTFDVSDLEVALGLSFLDPRGP